MTSGTNINLSTSTIMVGVNDKSGLQAAQPHSALVGSSVAGNTNAAQIGNTPPNDAGSETKSQPDTQQQKQLKNDEVRKQAQKLQELSQLKGWSVNFSIDQDLKETVVKVIDTDTKKVIRQIPSEDMLALAKRINELQKNENAGTNDLSGLLFDSKA